MIGLSIASDQVRDWCEFVGPLIQQSEAIPMHWILSWKFPYLAGHLQLRFKSNWSSRSSVPPKNGVTGLDHLETVLPTYWSTSFAVPLIPESNMAEEDQDMKMHEEKELCRG